MTEGDAVPFTAALAREGMLGRPPEELAGGTEGAGGGSGIDEEGVSREGSGVVLARVSSVRVGLPEDEVLEGCSPGAAGGGSILGILAVGPGKKSSDAGLAVSEVEAAVSLAGGSAGGVELTATSASFFHNDCTASVPATPAPTSTSKATTPPIAIHSLPDELPEDTEVGF